jgi:hypothetical protein
MIHLQHKEHSASFLSLVLRPKQLNLYISLKLTVNSTRQAASLTEQGSSGSYLLARVEERGTRGASHRLPRLAWTLIGHRQNLALRSNQRMSALHESCHFLSRLFQVKAFILESGHGAHTHSTPVLRQQANVHCSQS